VVLELVGLRTVLMDVVDGRVGGLLNVLPVVVVRDAGLVVDVVVDPTGRFVDAELESGRLVVLEAVDFFNGEAFSLPVSGLVTASDLDSSPDKRAASTGV
jgi:hypothetical protein